MKTPTDNTDVLAAQTRRHADESGQKPHAATGRELRHVLPSSTSGRRYRLSDPRAGDPHGTDPLESCSWQELRELIYGGNGYRSVRQADQDET